MTKQYVIKGMSCMGCVRSVKNSLEKVEGVASANIQLTLPQGVLELEHPVDLEVLQRAIDGYEIGEYTLSN